MNWNKYKVFYHVCKHKSITKAAEELFTSQPSISRQISELEKQYKVSLFTRTSTGIELTRRGAELYDVVQRIFSDTEIAENILTESEQSEQGVLHIHTTPALASFWLIELLADFIKSTPQVRLKITGDFDQKELDGPDVSIRGYEPKKSELVQLRLTTFNMRMFASKKYLDKFGRPSSVADFIDHKFVIIPSSFDANPNWVFSSIDIQLSDKNIALEVNSAHGLLLAAKKDMGIVELPMGFSGLDTSDLEIVMENISPIKVGVYFSYLHTYRNNKKIKLLTRFFMEKTKGEIL